MATHHVYTVTGEDGTLNTAVSVDTEWNREHGAWQARDDVGNVTIGRKGDTRHDVALRAFLGRVGLSTEHTTAGPLTTEEIDQRHAWMSVALRGMPNLEDILDRVCEQAREANRLREKVKALQRARDTAVDAWERHANADERRDPSAPYHDDVRQRIDSARKAGA